MTLIMSRAIARFEYGAWSVPDGGVLLWPWPRRSAPTTVNRSASRGAMSRHISFVYGNPCSNRTAGIAAPVSISSSSKPLTGPTVTIASDARQIYP